MTGTPFMFGTAPVNGGSAAVLYKLQGAGPPTDGVTGAGVVGTGELYYDTTNHVIYQNVGTKVAPAYSGIQQT